jgi:uncharacterized protein
MARLAQVLAPRERVFFDLFEAAAQNGLRAAAVLEDILDEWPDHRDLLPELLVCEEEGDRILHQVLDQLSQVFVTPLDRKDIHRLATALDAIVDRIQESVAFLDLHALETPMAPARQQAYILHYACRALAEAVPRLHGFQDISRHTVTVDQLENEGNRVVRAALAGLFDGDLGPLDVIRCKDVFQRLELAINAAKHVSDLLEGITIKNA